MNPPNIHILTLDCLRASERDLLPQLRRWADIFTADCYTSGTWTLPAHSTLYSAQSPISHGTVRNGDFLSESDAVVPNAARSAGFKTAMISENPTFGTGNGFGAEIDIIDEDIHYKRLVSTYSPAQDISEVSVQAATNILNGVIRSDSPIVNSINTLSAIVEHYRSTAATEFPHHGKRVLKHLSHHLKRNDNLFSITNLLDTHNPHYCPPPAGAEAVGLEMSSNESRALKSASDNREYIFDQPLSKETRAEFTTWDAVQSRMYDVYRAQVAYMDQILSEWISIYEEYLAKSLVILVGDHGQLFGVEGMVGHHVSLHPYGIAVPAAVSFPESWSVPNELPEEEVGLTGLARAILGVVSGEVKSASEFVNEWTHYPVITCVDGPTWRIEVLRDLYGKDAPQLSGLTVRKIGFIEDSIQTVHSCGWGSSTISTETYRITPDGRSSVDADPVELSPRQNKWIINAPTNQKDISVSDRLQALGYK